MDSEDHIASSSFRSSGKMGSSCFPVFFMLGSVFPSKQERLSELAQRAIGFSALQPHVNTPPACPNPLQLVAKLSCADHCLQLWASQPNLMAQEESSFLSVETSCSKSPSNLLSITSRSGCASQVDYSCLSAPRTPRQDALRVQSVTL